MELHYANDTNKEMLLSFILRGNKGGLKFSNPGKIGANAKGVINFIYTMSESENDEVVFNLEPYVNNKKLTETLQIKILNEKKRKQKNN
jgi:hypothetical protein